MATQDGPSDCPAADDEDDYMNMVIAEPSKPKDRETYTQRRKRKEREAEVSGRVKSKTEREAEEHAARHEALSRSLLEDPAAAQKSKGFAMMAKMGFQPGVALGSRDNASARMEPISISMKDDRGGIGLDTEKKRKIREAMEREGKRAKAEEGEYRERVRREREDMRLEGMFGAAMRVAERMDDEREEERMTLDKATVPRTDTLKERKISTRPLKQINKLWRGLIRQREERERDRRLRYDHPSLSRLPTYEDPSEDRHDRKALGRDVTRYTLVEDLEEEDPELDAFLALDAAERLESLVAHLRKEYNYCFWCKYTYTDQAMDGCPGPKEEDHD